MLPVYLFIIYLGQIVIILGLNYYACPKGTTMYEFLTFENAQHSGLTPLWVCFTPIVGTFVMYLSLLLFIPFFIHDRWGIKIKNLVKEKLNFKIK